MSVLSLPVVIYVFKFSILYRHGIFVGEDWDAFAQSYEAARITILHYHQFPWWNPWSAGGEPLFANPQFGLFSLQMPLVLIFGTVVGLHFSMFFYFVLGFWGMYLLLQRLNTNNKIIQALLSYVWVFSGFPALHLGGGHFTFAVYLIMPWVFLSLLNIRKKHGWIWFGLSTAFIVNTAPHYMTIQGLLVTGLLSLFEIYRYFRRLGKPISRTWQGAAKPYLYAGLVFLLLAGFKLLYTFQFLHEFPRLDALDDNTVPFTLFTAAVTFRHAVNPKIFFPAKWSWAEYADYFGLLTLSLAAFLFVKKMLNFRAITQRDWFVILGIFLCFLLYMGSFSPISPYHLLNSLPVFNQMRVPSRYIAWFTLGIIIFLRQLPHRKLIYVLLALSVIDVFAANYRALNYPEKKYVAPTHVSPSFQEYAYFDAHGSKDLMALSDFRLLRATQSNYGEVYGYDPVIGLGEYYNPITIRCGINQGCPFVMSNNARVKYWSPNKIVLVRTNSGPVELSMNPGKVWRVNGKPPFQYYRILDTGRSFIIHDPSKKLVISFSPAL